MFEALLRRADAEARRRVEARRSGLAERLRERLPSGIEVEPVEEGVQLSGRGLLRRLVVEPGLGWRLLQAGRDEGRRRE